jgi:hypothetical protein
LIALGGTPPLEKLLSTAKEGHLKLEPLLTIVESFAARQFYLSMIDQTRVPYGRLLAGVLAGRINNQHQPKNGTWNLEKGEDGRSLKSGTWA